MKQAITDREVLQNIELKCGDSENGYSFNDITMNGRLIAKVYNTPEIKTREVVELICKAVNERQKLIYENESIKKFLESLTPGGSEFHNDPIRCFSIIKEAMQGAETILKKIIAATKKENQTLLDSNIELRECLEILREHIIQLTDGYPSTLIGSADWKRIDNAIL